jgi:transcriptional regulator with XRE-family HTH domain
MSDIGKQVRAARERRGWSQVRLAEFAGVSQTTIDKIERGVTKQSRYLPNIARALRLDLDDMISHLRPSSLAKEAANQSEVMRKALEKMLSISKSSPNLEESAGDLAERQTDKASKGLPSSLLTEVTYQSEIMRRSLERFVSISRSLSKYEKFADSNLEELAIRQSEVIRKELAELRPAIIRSEYETVPLFPTEPIKESGCFTIGSDPIDEIERPRSLDRAVAAYALYIADDSMAPEFEYGDVAFVDPRHFPVPDTTCLFTKKAGGVGTIRRLKVTSADVWEVSQWSKKAGDVLVRSEWPTAHRIAAKYYRS